MTLLERQQLFAQLLARLLDRAHELGFAVTLGETYRPQETAELYALQGRGALRSLHPLRLAVDLHLFRDGRRYLTRTEDHLELGKWWEQLHPLCRWGGRFGDGNHYSVAFGGRA
jgi:hypothetical protein